MVDKWTCFSFLKKKPWNNTALRWMLCSRRDMRILLWSSVSNAAMKSIKIRIVKSREIVSDNKSPTRMQGQFFFFFSFYVQCQNSHSQQYLHKPSTVWLNVGKYLLWNIQQRFVMGGKHQSPAWTLRWTRSPAFRVLGPHNLPCNILNVGPLLLVLN